VLDYFTRLEMGGRLKGLPRRKANEILGGNQRTEKPLSENNPKPADRGKKHMAVNKGGREAS